MKIQEASVLVVDDEPQLKRFFVQWLERCGCQKVLSADNGVEALSILETERVDVVVSDIRMPLMDGVTMLDRIHQLGLAIPCVIFVSGFGVIDLPRLYSHGVEAILSKPIKSSTLTEVVKRCLADREELWQEAVLPAPPGRVDLRTALPPEEVIGRGGISGETTENPTEDRVEFTLTGERWPLVLRGQGIVRWYSKEPQTLGLEFEYLDPESQRLVVDTLKVSQSAQFIPWIDGRTGGIEPATGERL